MRNNINGDFNKVNEISYLKPGAFINISWNSKELMLPFSPRNGMISFSDNKWDFRYNYKNDSINESEPVLYELLPSGKFIEHKCILNDVA
tara:strand:+ start:2685 stop:2954 length:270 start_codon:yes stop_codon:yes gene_type:complete